MCKNKIEKIINAFIEKDVSEQIRQRFFFVLKYGKDKDLNSYMSQIWKETEAQTSDSTFLALDRIRILIDKQNKRYMSIRIFAKYAAVAIITAFCMLGIHSLYFGSTSKDNVIYMKELFVHNGEFKHIILNDGSEVWLDAGSILVYPEQFGTQSREIYLTGQARFKVKPNEQYPFIVKTKHINVEALGTIFSVQSYPELKSVSTILEDGSIQVSAETNDGNSIVHILKPNEKLVFYPQDDSIYVSNVDAYRLNKWIEGNLVFQDTDFESIVRSLERKYNVRINYDVYKFKDHRYFLRINQDESIEDALTLMSYMIEDFNYKINQSVITIY